MVIFSCTPFGCSTPPTPENSCYTNAIAHARVDIGSPLGNPSAQSSHSMEASCGEGRRREGTAGAITLKAVRWEPLGRSHFLLDMKWPSAANARSSKSSVRRPAAAPPAPSAAPPEWDRRCNPRVKPSLCSCNPQHAVTVCTKAQHMRCSDTPRKVLAALIYRSLMAAFSRIHGTCATKQAGPAPPACIHRQGTHSSSRQHSAFRLPAAVPWRSLRASSRILRSSSSCRSRALARVALSAFKIAAVSGLPAISACAQGGRPPRPAQDPSPHLECKRWRPPHDMYQSACRRQGGVTAPQCACAHPRPGRAAGACTTQS